VQTRAQQRAAVAKAHPGAAASSGQRRVAALLVVCAQAAGGLVQQNDARGEGRTALRLQLH